MKTIYFECLMGASGDMLCASLLELFDDQKEIVDKLNGIGLPGIVFGAKKTSKRGVGGARFTVKAYGAEEDENSTGLPSEKARSLSEVIAIIDDLRVSKKVIADAKEVYKIIAEAEGAVHGEAVGDIHFHEVGALDAIADITAFCFMLELLNPEKILASYVTTGFGHVKCAHGLLPVPAPATALILNGVPIRAGDIESELCTPTGAALLKYFVDDFGPAPLFILNKTGCGFGKKDFEKINCVRAFIGEAEDIYNEETITELSCNLDDMTPEAVSFAQALLTEEGALDVTVIPAVMKKGRAGVLFICLCKNEAKNRFASLIFKHTTTLGVRFRETARYTLKREEASVETPYGKIGIKTAEGFGIKKSKPEFEDVSAAAKAGGIPLDAVYKSIHRGENQCITS